MAQTVCLILTEADEVRLSAIVTDRARPLKHIQRAHIVLLSAKRLPVLEVEPLRVSRRLFGLDQAAKACTLAWA